MRNSWDWWMLNILLAIGHSKKIYFALSRKTLHFRCTWHFLGKLNNLARLKTLIYHAIEMINDDWWPRIWQCRCDWLKTIQIDIRHHTSTSPLKSENPFFAANPCVYYALAAGRNISIRNILIFVTFFPHQTCHSDASDITILHYGL